MTDEDVDDLTKICDDAQTAVDENGFDVRLSVAFHARLAAAAHNRALNLLFDSFQGAILLTLMRARDASPVHGLRGLNEHRRLIEALQARDGVEATRIMGQHLDRTARTRRHGV